jgi:PAS domain-containing protein
MIDIRTALKLLVIALREWRCLPLPVLAAWAFGCWCVLVPALAPAASASANEPRNVLILHSYHQGLPWTDSEQEGITTGLGQHLPEFGIYIEYLDALRFPLPAENEQSEIVRRLAERYAKPGIDILVATDDPAYRLLLAHRDHFWPGKPLLFAGVNNIGSSDLAGLENVAGVSEAPDFPANLNLIQQFHPKTNRLVIIGDDTKTFASNRATLEAANAALPKPFAIEVVTHRLLKEVMSDLKALSGDFVVVLMGRPFDESGRIVPESESAAALRSSTTRPLYSAWSFFLDHGIVGGKLVSGKDQGMAVARLVLDLHAGKVFSDLPRLTASPNRYMFDYEELDRFGLTRHALPSNSIVINRPHPIWDAYPRTFVGAVALMVFLLVLLTFQARNLRIKRQLSAEVEKELVLVQALMNAVPFPMFFKDISLRYQRFNRAFSGFLATSQEPLTGQNTHPVAAIEQVSIERIKDEELLAAGGQQIYETKVASANDDARDIVFHKAVVRLPNGQLEGIVGAMLDVTELRKVERDVRELNLNLEQRVAERTAELRRQQVFTQAVLENVSDGVIACDQRGMLSFFNRAAREMHGIAQESLPPERWAERYRLYQADGATPMMMADIPLFRAFRGEMIRNEPMTLEQVGGRKLVVLASGQAMSDRAGGQGRGGSGQPGQERVSGQHEPRAAHAAERDSGLLGAAAAGRRHRRPRPGAPGHHQPQRRAPAGADQRHPGHGQDRGRPGAVADRAARPGRRWCATSWA